MAQNCVLLISVTFIKFSHNAIHFFFVYSFYPLTNAELCNCHLIRIQFHPTIPYAAPSSLPLIQGNYRPLLSPSSFAISRTSYKWNHREGNL